MDHVWVILFALAATIVVYTYLIYPILLLALHAGKTVADNIRYLITRRGRRIADRAGFPVEELPTVSFLVAARNEEEILSEKIQNFFDIDYPHDKMELLIGSDASSDNTVEIAKSCRDARVRVFDFEERSGKIGVLQKLVPEAQGDIVVLSDTNTFLRRPALRMLIRPFADPRVGAVCGELRLEAPDGTLQSEGAYWRYETILKTLENSFGCVLGANGGNYAVRRSLFPEIAGDTIIEDFVIPLKIRGAGYKTPFEPEALAVERNPVDVTAEFRRRVRIGAGDAQSVSMIYPLLSPKHGMLAFALWSHKILRWLVPFALIVAVASNLALVDRPFFVVTLVLQLLLYVAAGVGWYRQVRGKPPGVVGLPLMFVLLNAALAVGYVQFFTGRHKVSWDRTKRVEIT
ncbi:MAG: glycosyltransferase family 2 protein [Candidatus Krumholzibacteria bacterium]|nr:glycosyltransferase family 2 protein [Candidatus Krumholzibacteria bacterium]